MTKVHRNYLPADDAALTRPEARHSQRRAVVVRFSRTRKRYERQGLLVEEGALRKAEEECTSDAEERARVRARASVLREERDRELVQKVIRRVQELFPTYPPKEGGRSIPVRLCAAGGAWAARLLAGHWTRKRYGLL
jgi:hypothetical protein